MRARDLPRTKARRANTLPAKKRGMRKPPAMVKGKGRGAAAPRPRRSPYGSSKKGK